MNRYEGPLAHSFPHQTIGDADKRKVHDGLGGLEFHSSHDVQMAKMYGLAVSVMVAVVFCDEST
jgi:hypothetical protein